MRINAHAHIFTLRTILSREAVRVITQRLRDKGLRDFLVDAVEQMLDDFLDKPEHLDERELLARLLSKLAGIGSFDDFLEENLGRLPMAVVIRGGSLDRLPADVLQTALDNISSVIAEKDGVGKSPFDIVQALRYAMKSTITEVADQLLDQMDPDDALVALMMDIHAPDEPERDRQNFLLQVSGTEEAALQRPGRVLPFFGVHPARPGHFELMTEAIERRGFLGVKLYPSLGYEVDDPALLRVYRYCLDKDVPVLLHCGHGGFYRKQEYIDYCNPDNWIPVLEGDFAELRVCFAHFGGWQSLGRPDGLDEGTWGRTILDLMQNKPNVFTDLAYHTDQMKDSADEEHYFTKLAELLQDERLQRRILFGTDSWLLRLDMADIVFWRYFQHHMTEGDFDTIASRAPRLFVGFPEVAGQPLRANLQRYVDHMTEHREEVGAEPAAWLTEAVALAFVTNRSAAEWNYDTHAVKCTYQFAKDLMSNAQKAKGFQVNRSLRLRDLSYWRPRDPNFDGTCQHNARLLLAFCRQIADFGSGYDENTAMSLCTDVFRSGEKTLVELAAVLESVFAFTRRMA